MDFKFLHLSVTLALLALVTPSSTSHNSECKSNSECNPQSTFMTCFLRYEPGKTGNCRCRDGTVYNGTECVGQADGECRGANPSNCVAGASCDDNFRCKCRPLYSAKPISESNELFCRGTYGAECPIGGPDDDCDNLLGDNRNGLQCTPGVDPENPGRRECRCAPNRAWNSKRQQCLLVDGSGECLEDDHCIDNAICSSSRVCACYEFGFEYARTARQCRRKFDENCTATTDCNTDKRVSCVSGKCTCANNEVYDFDTSGLLQCRKLAGGPCENDGDCGGDTKCHEIDNVCFCDRSDQEKPMVELTNKRCGLMNGTLNGYCESTGNCGVGNYLNCTKVGTATVGQCLCQNGMQYIEGERGCRHLAGEACPLNHGCVRNAACIDERCVCKDGFIRTSDDKCLKVGQSCSFLEECNHGGLTCLAGQCNCPEGQYWSPEQSHCVAFVSGNCTETNELCTSNAHCSSRGVCECDQGYSVLRDTYHGTDKYRTCVPTYNTTCNPTESVPCNDEEFLTCDPASNTCKCLYHLQQAWDSSIKACASLPSGFCGTLPELGGREMRCLGSSTCHTEAEADVIGRCKCNSGFSVSENENICTRTSGALGSMSGISMTSLMSFLGLYVFMGKFAV